MTGNRISPVYWPLVFSLFFLPLSLQAEVNLPQAVDFGCTKLVKLMQQSQYYRIEYDTVIALPVHSEVAEKGNYYLLYFIHEKQFQMEMEIDRQTGQSTVLAVGKMSPPYTELPEGTFNYRCFSPDSLLRSGSYQVRPEQDSVRLIYLGLAPKLGKRGVAWQRFLGTRIDYISLDGLSLSAEDIARKGDSADHALPSRRDQVMPPLGH